VTAAAVLAGGCRGGGASASDAGTSGPSIPGLSTLINLVGFEGEIEFSIGLGGSLGLKMAPMKMSFLAKGQRLAYDMGSLGSSGMRVLIDGSERKAYMINDTAKEYTASDLAPVASSASTAAAPAPKITKTSTRDRVAGYDCEVWNIVEGTRTIEVCAARGLSFLGLGLAFGNVTRGATGWASALASAGYFPMRALERDASGADIWRYEVSRVDKKSVPEAKISLPPGYVDKTVPIVPVAPRPTTGAPLTL
jgi:hypothetical protein